MGGRQQAREYKPYGATERVTCYQEHEAGCRDGAEDIAVVREGLPGKVAFKQSSDGSGGRKGCLEKRAAPGKALSGTSLVSPRHSKKVREVTAVSCGRW